MRADEKKDSAVLGDQSRRNTSGVNKGGRPAPKRTPVIMENLGNSGKEWFCESNWSENAFFDVLFQARLTLYYLRDA
jgi:hypothetical protein